MHSKPPTAAFAAFMVVLLIGWFVGLTAGFPFVGILGGAAAGAALIAWLGGDA